MTAKKDPFDDLFDFHFEEFDEGFGRLSWLERLRNWIRSKL